MIGCAPGVKRENGLPVALTIAGSDSGGGAGIQADLKTFAALQVHGLTALTCVTAQNPDRVLQIHACPVGLVRAQLAALFEAMPPAAVKTGMLYSASILQAVADFLRTHPVLLVVDPVMVSTSGTQLLSPRALSVSCRELLPLATLITPNLHEAEVLLSARIRSPEDLRQAARELHRRFGAAALVKGGHLRGMREAVDLFYDGSEELLLMAPFVRGVKTHGTGCTYSAAIAAALARGLRLTDAVVLAKEFVTRAIAQSRQAGRHWVLCPFRSGSLSFSWTRDRVRGRRRRRHA